jgi:ATP-dependent Clp protease ATP-binding subunit ClpA
MFERFTTAARTVVTGAQDQARELRHNYIGTEHLLLALLVTGADGRAGRALAGAGVRADAVRDEIARRVGTGPVRLGEADAEALRAIGIDLDAVREKVEESFGPGALDEPAGGTQEPGRGLIDRLRGRRRTPETPRSAGAKHSPDPARPRRHIPFTPRSKKVLELALREAIHLRHDHIGPEHILLGVLREGHGLAMQILVETGVDVDELRRRVQEGNERAA